MSTILFTAWGYPVSILESVAALTSLIGVWLGTTRKRITWPWWALSSTLYGVFFYQANLLGSAALQIVFVIAAGLGWAALAPLLSRIGAAATWVDSFLFVGSFIAQILMVLQKYESWPLWLVVDVVGTALYAQQGYWFTSLLYFIFTIVAIIGWKNWYESRSSAH